MSEIRLVPYDKNWPEKFHAERKAILATVRIDELSVHHIGSTSVSNLAAKPIIDILIEVPEIKQIDQHIQSFEAIGYESLGEYGIDGRRYFRKGSTARTHHIHAFSRGSHGAKRHLAFSRYLEHYPDIANEYQAVKYKAAEECAGDSSVYCDLKNDFVVYHEGKALVWAELTGPIDK